ncbi:MAG: hypothetical protein ACOX8E_02675 [Ruminococcus sp.]
MKFLYGDVGHCRRHLIDMTIYTVLGTELICRLRPAAAGHLIYRDPLAA